MKFAWMKKIIWPTNMFLERDTYQQTYIAQNLVHMPHSLIDMEQTKGMGVDFFYFLIFFQILS